jgi:hypothetical protein
MQQGTAMGNYSSLFTLRSILRILKTTRLLLADKRANQEKYNL